MKKFIANNWKKILIIIGVVLIIINVGLKVMQEPSVITGYIENGPVIEKDIFDSFGNPGEIKDNAADIKDEYGERTGIDTKLFKIMVVGIILLIVLVVFTSLFGSDEKKDDKKKK